MIWRVKFIGAVAMRLFPIVCLAFALFLTPIQARAQSVFERLVTPGEVTQAHAKFEKTCESCHEPFSKKNQRRLCLDCHKEISSDIASKRGLHGKRSEIVAAECKSCHSDHKGRDFDIVQFDRETFSHAATNFVLKGGHTRVPCEGCHVKGEKFRKAASECAACHKAQDVHKGRLGTQCANCHNEEGWRKQKTFDHSKTKFPLVGAHVKTACDSCHAGERYKDLPLTCAGCHSLHDPHKGRFGSKCETCHGTQSWKTISFDHAKNTKFPLLGAHAKTACEGCHRGDLYKDKLSRQCITCHKGNDVHGGSLGTACEKCHNETSWRQKVSFDHDVTRFPLIGLHATVPCEDCHKSSVYKGTPLNCSACHKDDHHQGRLGAACQLCHNPNGWTLWRFDHDRQTQFPLDGAHKGLRCETCHTAPAEAKVTAPKTCFGCHSKDDAHRGAFGRSCEKCHVTRSFRDVLRAR